MQDKFACWEVQVALKEMDMSGGDNIDGPRWTGKYLDVTVSLFIVATTQTLAEAGAMSGFYEHQRATVKGANKIADVYAVVHVTRST